MSKKVKYPYLPKGKTIEYVAAENPYMLDAREFARAFSLDAVMPGAAVIVRRGVILGSGANGSEYHKENGCKRVALRCKSGEGYELCEGCHPKNHSEPSAIRDAKKNGNETKGASLYLWGHWWCCKSCWDAMIEAEIDYVFLLAGSETLFNKEHPENIVGKQFAV